MYEGWTSWVWNNQIWVINSESSTMNHESIALMSHNQDPICNNGLLNHYFEHFSKNSARPRKTSSFITTCASKNGQIHFHHTWCYHHCVGFLIKKRLKCDLELHLGKNHILDKLIENTVTNCISLIRDPLWKWYFRRINDKLILNYVLACFGLGELFIFAETIWEFHFRRLKT